LNSSGGSARVGPRARPAHAPSPEGPMTSFKHRLHRKRAKKASKRKAEKASAQKKAGKR